MVSMYEDGIMKPTKNCWKWGDGEGEKKEQLRGLIQSTMYNYYTLIKVKIKPC
jgi:hypothetical protein